MNASGIFGATQILVEILEDMGVSYFIGGSVASSVHGLPRSTLDVDLVADLSLDHVQPLVECSQATFYIDDEMVEDAVKREASFNVIHLRDYDQAGCFGCAQSAGRDVGYDLYEAVGKGTASRYFAAARFGRNRPGRIVTSGLFLK